MSGICSNLGFVRLALRRWVRQAINPLVDALPVQAKFKRQGEGYSLRPWYRILLMGWVARESKHKK